MNERNLPLKLILHKENDTVKNKGGGGKKYFCEINDELTDRIVTCFNDLLSYYSDVFQENDQTPAVGKICVRKEAIAKSHKPNALCRECSIIGSGELGEVYIKLNKKSIENTIRLVKEPPSKEFKANMTAIENIEPYTMEDKISESIIQLEENALFDSVKDRIKIKLFDFDDDYDNSLIMNYVMRKLDELGLAETSELITYGEHIKYIKLSTNSYNDIMNISRINGIKKIDFFNSFTLPLDTQIVTPPTIDINRDEWVESETIIGIIDSGISESNPYLAPYVVSREEYVPKEYQNRKHGTFVASTIQYGNILNGIETDHKQLFKFVDVVAVPNSDSDFGPTDGLEETDFMRIVVETMKKYSHRVKIWNFSLGLSNYICSDSISDLGAFFDLIQDLYGVQFIVSSGNYENINQRTWPPQEGLGESDRITSPADSIRSLTVGSVALYDSPESIVKKNEPSSFSRRGPGASYIVKPEVVDYGGNVNIGYSETNVALIGLDLDGNITGNVGTSFSAPRITQKLACVLEDMIEKDILLAKALLIHSARLNSKETIETKNAINYYGFGMPDVDAKDILNCSKDEVTLIFRQKVKKGTHLEMMDFPYPKSLVKNGKCYGEICMTLLYAPPLDIKFGQEYCRSNIDVSFGTCKRDHSGKLNYTGQVPLEATWEEKFESFRVENGFKWSPVKAYYRKLPRGTQLGEGWKIRVDLTERNEADVSNQEFVLIVTVKDPGKNDIYSDVVNMLREKGYIAEDLQTRYNVRERSTI